VNIPNSVTSIGTGAFCACSSLTLVKIPDGVTSISEYTFNGCKSLTSVKIPEDVTISEGSFEGCSNFVYYSRVKYDFPKEMYVCTPYFKSENTLTYKEYLSFNNKIRILRQSPQVMEKILTLLLCFLRIKNNDDKNYDDIARNIIIFI